MKRKCKGLVTSESKMLYTLKKGELVPLGRVHESVSITWPEKCIYDIFDGEITIWDSIGREILRTKLYSENEIDTLSGLSV
mgnify:CR=1 FL=1